MLERFVSYSVNYERVKIYFKILADMIRMGRRRLILSLSVLSKQRYLPSALNKPDI